MGGHLFWKFIGLVILLAPAAVRAQDERVMIECDYGIELNVEMKMSFLLIPSEKKVLWFRQESIVEGSLELSEFTYTLRFPSTDTSYMSLQVVNRYTGIWNSEFGDRPFGENDEGNIQRSGTCRRLDRLQLF